MELHREGLQRRLVRAKGQIAVASTGTGWERLHQKRRRLSNLKARLEKLDFRTKKAVLEGKSPRYIRMLSS